MFINKEDENESLIASHYSLMCFYFIETFIPIHFLLTYFIIPGRVSPNFSHQTITLTNKSNHHSGYISTKLQRKLPE